MHFLKKMFSFSIGNIAALFIGVISIPIITRLIPPAEYGIANLFVTVGSLLSIISLAGLDQAFVRFFYETKKIDLLKKCLIVTLTITLILSVFLVFFDSKFSRLISPDSSFSILLILYILTLMIFQFSVLILRMMQYGYRYSLIQVLQKIFDLLFIVSLVFLFSPDRYAVIIGTIITFSILSLITLYLSRPFWKINDNETRKISYKELLKYSIPLLGASFMAILFQSTDKLLLNKWVSNEELGIYTAAFKLIAILNIIQSSFAVIWAPVSIENYKKNPENRDFFSKISKIITITMIMVCILVVLFKDIIVLFLGSEYREASSIIAFLTLMPVLYTMSETTVQGVNFVLKSYIHIIISSVSLILNILLCLLFIPRLGTIGAAVALCLSYFVFYLLRTYFGLKYFYFNIKIWETIIMLSLLIFWISLVVFIGNKLILFLGGSFLVTLLFILFKQEVYEIGTFMKMNFHLMNYKYKNKNHSD
ncbi:lipopolysaccharide biosynthesis protein [Neobacillus sp. SCS-31]|uniref:lipopolysaccharide biosynthesis protein n=1 Tax=Neobacillus oceani TaxID=3115292 RepID=UPI00390611F6